MHVRSCLSEAPWSSLGAAAVAAVDDLLAAFEEGRKMGSMEYFLKRRKDALNTRDMAKLYGAWTSVYQTKPIKSLLRA